MLFYFIKKFIWLLCEKQVTERAEIEGKEQRKSRIEEQVREGAGIVGSEAMLVVQSRDGGGNKDGEM